jgi:hypothetical protein
MGLLCGINSLERSATSPSKSLRSSIPPALRISPDYRPTVPYVNQPTRAWLCRKNFPSVTKDSGDDEEIESKPAYNSAVGWPHNENYCQRSKLSVRALIISASRRDINVMPANAHSSDHKNICGSGCGCGRTMVCRNMMKERATDKGWNC